LPSVGRVEERDEPEADAFRKLDRPRKPARRSHRAAGNLRPVREDLPARVAAGHALSGDEVRAPKPERQDAGPLRDGDAPVLLPRASACELLGRRSLQSATFLVAIRYPVRGDVTSAFLDAVRDGPVWGARGSERRLQPTCEGAPARRDRPPRRGAP